MVWFLMSIMQLLMMILKYHWKSSCLDFDNLISCKTSLDTYALMNDFSIHVKQIVCPCDSAHLSYDSFEALKSANVSRRFYWYFLQRWAAHQTFTNHTSSCADAGHNRALRRSITDLLVSILTVIPYLSGCYWHFHPSSWHLTKTSCWWVLYERWNWKRKKDI